MAEIVSFGKTESQLEDYNSRSVQYKLEAGLISEEDIALIDEFVNAQRVETGAGTARAYKLKNTLLNLTRFVKIPLRTNTIGDINAAVLRIKSGNKVTSRIVKDRPEETEGTYVQKISVRGMTYFHVTREGKKLSQDSQKDYITILKRFYLWLVESGYSDVSAEKLRKIRAPPAKRSGKTAEEMLTEEEVMRMIEVCKGTTQIRDRAIISLLYESGMRINELCKLTWSNLKFDTAFIKLNIESKTGIPRYVPLVSCRSYLAQWKSIYPEEITEDSPVFVTAAKIDHSVEHRTFTYNYIAKLLRKQAKAANVNKHITCHLYRHSRVTGLLQQGFSESIIKSMMWGSSSTEMLSHYSHLTNADTDKAVAQAAGINIESEVEKSKKAFQNRVCVRCHSINSPTAKYCETCGAPLTEEVRLELSEAQEQIHADKRYISMLEKLQKQVNDLTAIISSQS